MSKTTWPNGQTTQNLHVINFIPLSVTFQSPGWGFPPSSPISSLWVECSNTQHWIQTLSPLKPWWAARGSMLKALGNAGRSHQRLQVGKVPSSRAGAGKQLGKATFCRGLVSALQWPREQHCSWARTSCGQWNGSRAANGRSAGSALCSMERDPCR